MLASRQLDPGLAQGASRGGAWRALLHLDPLRIHWTEFLQSFVKETLNTWYEVLVLRVQILFPPLLSFWSTLSVATSRPQKRKNIVFCFVFLTLQKMHCE